MAEVYRAKVRAWNGARTEPASISAPSAPTAIQNTLPTSAYGQTVPWLWGKARIPGGYIWSPAIQTITETETTSTGSGPWQVFSTETTTRSLLSARIRFGRPLVPDSTWSLRQLWGSGKLLFDGSTGYRAKGLKFRFYDGSSTQPRDPLMVRLEGEDEVSAHRGYIDLVIEDLNVTGLGGPPVFEAEIIQETAASFQTDSFTSFFADQIDTYAAADWDDGTFYGYSSTSNLIRKFSIGDVREIYAVPLVFSGPYSAIEEGFFHYVPEMDRILAVGFDPHPATGGSFPMLIDPQTGAATAEAAASIGGPGQSINAATCAIIGTVGIMVAASHHIGYLTVYRFTADAIERISLSAAPWDGRGVPHCLTTGEVRADAADIWVCAGAILYKLQVSSNGLITSIVEHATFADDPIYAVYDDGDLVVWTDNLQVIRIDGATGATGYTQTAPYQIGAGAENGSLAPPASHRLDGTLFYQGSAAFYFTDLVTGLTATVAKTTSPTGRFVYDGEANWIVTTDASGSPTRTIFEAAGDGTQRNLSDLLEDLMVHGGGYSASQVDTINIDDVIDGAVIDVSGGARQVARSICEPYSIAMFERAGVVTFKRAATDGSFAVDAVLASTDFKDTGGQAIRARRLNPEEFISRYGINYRDPAEIYQARAQYGEIPSLPFPVATADMAIKADIPIIVDADTIKELATQKVNRLAVERHEFSFTLRSKFSDMEPEDVIQFTFAGRLVTARITETTLHPDFSISIKCTEFLSSVSVSISGATGRPTEPDAVGSPASRYQHLDIPLIADAHDLGVGGLVQYHVLASAGQTNWDGATLYRKDAAGTYQAQISQATDGLVGIALVALPDWDIPYVTEFTRSIDVAIISGDTDLLVSKTYLEIMNGANFFAIGTPGRWEVCQVMTITNNADGTFTFEGLRRGRGSSEEYTGDHAIGDFVVWLSEDNVQRLSYTIASLDDAFDFKPVGFGGSVSGTIAVNRTITGEAEKIPKPAHLDAAIDGSDIDMSWIRRSRIGAYWSDDGDWTTPLGESLEQYVVRIKDGPGGTVVRTVTVDDAETYTYTAADQTTYSGGTFSAGDSFTFDVRQVSGTGAVCPAREATITL